MDFFGSEFEEFMSYMLTHPKEDPFDDEYNEDDDDWDD